MKKLFTLLFLLSGFTVYAEESDKKHDEKVMHSMFDMSVIEKQLEEYKKEHGSYPKDEVEFNDIQKYNITVLPDHSIQNRFMEGNNPYSRAMKWEGFKFPKPDMLDGWGRKYEYRSNGVKYSIHSYGEDGKEGGDGKKADIIIYKDR